MRAILLIPVALVLIAGCDTQEPQPPLEGDPPDALVYVPDWRLVWSDEFNADGAPDPSKWTYEVGRLRNQEAQYYTDARPENARIEDGRLVIEARREAYEGADYTSASLTTRYKASWTYGRIEVRAKLPTGRGLWPAIFTFGTRFDEIGWPRSGEIDIMENFGFDPDRVTSSIHTLAFNHTIGTSKTASKIIAAPYDQFHVYAVEWYRNRIITFVDGERLLVYRKLPGYGPEEWPFYDPQFLLLNVAVGGTAGGWIDESVFPQRMEVDYVRVYQEARRL